ncbi:malonyl-CoA O-methyltransferase [Paenibacillus sp. 1_12]|uniref:malonyl-ACP O-methyltransferase BioC n=1 Tax=Paenibacillus sp. 1_12 TaxID=1566278 RepID=UPI0008E51A1E|nr:malonyl-ACP O-methyltransferase BioC [Paenibacillus sp. 1_12]SFL36847.1 malonyl-CoA O-methyltransferase [Paenibacillus sp. 1_12]
MSNRKHTIRSRFNRSAAGSYDIHDRVQRMMADRVIQSIQRSKNEGDTEQLDILEIGCGTGGLTEILCNEWSWLSMTALDIAPAMIEVAEQRVLSSIKNHVGYSNRQPNRLRFHHADVEMWASDARNGSFDLIVSNACFQWLSNPGQTLCHLRRMLRAGGLLVFTTFGPDTFYELHKAFDEAYRISGIEPQRHGLSFQSTGQWENLLEEAGFSDIQYECSIHNEKHSTARDFLLSVKAMGASTSEAATICGLSSRRLFANMYKEYEARFSIEGGVAATYDLLLFQACASQ